VDLNIVDAQADCAVFAGHKTLMGPFGAAGVMIRRSVVLEPLLYGGTGQDSANPDMPAEAPSRYEAGSHNMLAIAGLTAALEWLAGQGTAKVMARENDNKERLIELLGQYDFIRPILADRQIGVVSAVFAGLSSDEAGQILAEQGIAVRTGLHCAPAAHRFLGTFPAGTVRFSVSCLTGEEDFNKLRIALDYIQDEL
jgi:selenocysteine lyase/cysteine desulfurase